MVIGIALWLGGCSIPLPSMLGPGDETGAIDQPVSPLSNALDVEDWRRAKSALTVALDRQSGGAPVTWDNPASGVKGSFIPVGDAFSSDKTVCRAFFAKIGGTVPEQNLSGTGCRDAAGNWTVADVRPSSKV